MSENAEGGRDWCTDRVRECRPPVKSLGLQRDTLENAGCEMVFEDDASGAKTARPGLIEVLEHTRRGGVPVGWRRSTSSMGRFMP